MNTPSSRADRTAALPERLREALARRLAGQGGTATGTAAPLVPAVSRDGDLRLSFGQQRLWFLEDFAPGGADYHSALPVRISGPLDAEALRGAVRDLVARHEALRTTFDARERRGHGRGAEQRGPASAARPRPARRHPGEGCPVPLR
ncbi:condensation domain-containing protein [Streptomyces seoulensis]|uniref:condensation domain-containing protein n=1 Tax=Streptomyces seoulensis TaxID=73044 RepID=UPI0022783C9D|nr:condensation domain-containing protein [Streptomyces seoulensis]